MNKNKKKIVVGNWKMEPVSLREAVIIAGKINNLVKKIKKTQVVLCLPVLFLGEINKIVSQNKFISLGAQDAFGETEGEYTGEISPLALKKTGVKYVIVGHSDRRKNGETAEIINKKTNFLLKLGFKVIFCVGEEKRDKTGEYLREIKNQIEAGLKGIQKKYLNNLIVAYEPVWVGNKNSKEPTCLSGRQDFSDHIAGTSLFIKKVLAELAGRDIGFNIPIIYGGDFFVENVREILRKEAIDGLLVNKPSLSPDKFSYIIKEAELKNNKK